MPEDLSLSFALESMIYGIYVCSCGFACAQVRTDFSKKSIVISVDGTESEQTAIKGQSLDVEGKLYVGGLPTGYTAKRIGNVSVYLFPKLILHKN